MSGAGGESVTALQVMALPYNKEVEFQHVVYENGFAILRLRIREGKRFTMLDLDAETAAQLGQALTEWALDNRSEQVE